MTEQDAVAYIDEIKSEDHCDAWIVGKVIEDLNQKAIITDDATFLEV